MKPPTDDERALVAAFLGRGDERAFRELYRRHTPVLYLLARRLLGGSGLGAEDAVQEAWIRASQRFDAFRWESSLRTWLSGIVVRCCREAIRARRSAAAPGTIDGIEAEGSGDAADRRPEGIDLERAMARLPDGYREVLLLHDVEGYTHEEIAARLGIRDGTSKSQLFKARRTLRALLRAASDAARMEFETDG